ncbi:MAG TPA: TatD family hydrolase [Candidatus Sulfotelmatobacter sp.]|nr:TatD family hydrolase [Candidatus Sulfotelmatobacter sp.]
MFVDSHAHLDGKQFDSDREQVIARAREAGVRTMVAIGNGDGPPNFDAGIQLAEKHPFLYATIGIHPHEARLASEHAYAEMERLARHPKVIAWGEIGLDYFYDHSPRDIQKQVFVRQMELAASAKLPIVIHCRPSDNSDNAWDDCLGLIQSEWAMKGIGGILHCFTGKWQQAKRALDMGFMISFAGNVTFPKAQQIRDAALQVPLDRMLIETDCPYLAPVPYRGKRNEPAYVQETARQLGELRGISMEAMGDPTARNFYNFFKLSEMVESKVPAS